MSDVTVEAEYTPHAHMGGTHNKTSVSQNFTEREGQTASQNGPCGPCLTAQTLTGFTVRLTDTSYQNIYTHPKKKKNTTMKPRAVSRCACVCLTICGSLASCVNPHYHDAAENRNKPT